MEASEEIRDMAVDDVEEEEFYQMQTTSTIFHVSSTSYPLKRKCCKDEDSEEVYEVLRGIKKIKFPVNIKVKTLNGRLIEVDLDANDTVDKIKLILLEREGIPIHKQKLIFNGKQVTEGELISSCGIINGSVVFLVIALPHKNGYSGISFEHRIDNVL